MDNNSALLDFAKLLDIPFNDTSLLQRVFIHRSYINEHGNGNLEHNERLEFLGDAVLELVITEYLYTNYPNPEGELTNWRSAIVKGETLAVIAKEINMGDHLKLSRGEERSGGKSRDLLLANAFEALIGAIYLDQGYGKAQKFIYALLLPRLEVIIQDGSSQDSKSKLQEYVQEKEGITPIYKVLQETGPDHDKIFEIGVYVRDTEIGKGTGSSKRKAEQLAAAEGLKYYNK